MSSPTRAPTIVVTVLTPAERNSVDAAGDGVYQTFHRESIDEAMQELRTRPAAAVLVSATRCDTVSATRLSRLVREFPRVRAVALLSQFETQSARSVLAFGSSGVHRLVDVRQPGGWHELRAALANDHCAEIRRAAVEHLARDLAEAPQGCHRFFEALFTCGDDVVTVRRLAELLGVLPSTMTSRFFRAGLPAPKRYLSEARLVRAARLLENTGASLARVANQLEYSSPQSFGRHVRTLLCLSAGEFRRRFDGGGMLAHFREELVLPYRETLLTFEPLS